MFYSSEGITDDSVNKYGRRQYKFKDSNYELVLSSKGFTSGVNYKQLTFGSLFTTNDNLVRDEFALNDLENQNFSYKMFSFNFKIPKVGWNKLGDIMYAKNPYFKTNILTNGEKNLLYNDDNYICPVSGLTNMSNSNVIFEGVLSFVYLVLDNRVVEQVVGSGNYGNGGYRDANGQYHKGAMIDDSNVQMGGSADKTLEDAYNATYIRIPFTAKLLNNGTKLNVTSPNDTLAFTADLSDDRIISGGGTPENGVKTLYKHDIVTLDGLFTQVTVNDILHNVLIPSMKLHVFVGYDVNSSRYKTRKL